MRQKAWFKLLNTRDWVAKVFLSLCSPRDFADQCLARFFSGNLGMLVFKVLRSLMTNARKIFSQAEWMKLQIGFLSMYLRKFQF